MCSCEISERKIQHLIENSLIVDHAQRCKLCNGPTIHRPGANLGHRCFHFPRCSGQADLFASVVHSYVFLDFETTGLDPTREEIIEIGALKIDEDGFEHTFQEFVKPAGSIGAHITQITGITNEMVECALGIEDVLPRFLTFLGSSKLVAHNAEFDIPWLLVKTEQLGLSLGGHEVLCTLKWARRAKEPRAGLGALAKKYKLAHENAHRALADACSTRELFLIFENQYAVERQEESLDQYRAFSLKMGR